MTDVVAAFIQKDGKILICLRPPDKPNPLLWEFVGGKVESGETLKEALKRECREELDVEISVNDVFFETYHEYPDRYIHLTLFNAEIIKNEPKLIVHKDIRWVTPNELAEYDFCPADKEIIEKIVKLYG